MRIDRGSRGLELTHNIKLSILCSSASHRETQWWTVEARLKPAKCIASALIRVTTHQSHLIEFAVSLD